MSEQVKQREALLDLQKRAQDLKRRIALGREQIVDLGIVLDEVWRELDMYSESLAHLRKEANVVSLQAWKDAVESLEDTEARLTLAEQDLDAAVGHVESLEKQLADVEALIRSKESLLSKLGRLFHFRRAS
jgi:chromosome segregation ATPase